MHLGRALCAGSLRASLVTLKFQHSPGRVTHAEAETVAHYLPLGKGLGQDIGGHVVCRAVNKVDYLPRNALVDEMVANVDVLSARMVVVVDSKRECCLVVAMECRL